MDSTSPVGPAVKRARLRIALILDEAPNHGGPSTDSWRGLVVSSMLTSTVDDDVTVFAAGDAIPLPRGPRALPLVRFDGGVDATFDRWSATLWGNAAARRVRALGARTFGRSLDARLESARTDLVILLHPFGVASRIGDHPFLVAVHDVRHRDCPGARDVYEDRAFERRERSLATTLPRAAGVFVPAEAVGSRISELYHVPRERIVTIDSSASPAWGPVLDDFAWLARRWSWPP
jgi:hypothetical protein